jgi:hypothetical protein
VLGREVFLLVGGARFAPRAALSPELFGALILVSACGEASPRVEATPRPAVSVKTSAPRGEASAAPSARVSEPPPAARACPDDMVLVDSEHCTDVERTCLDDEYTKSNKITICHKFEKKPGRCVGETRRQRFCIDTFEYPNEKGAKPPVMVDFHDAAGLCAEKGKRLCWESEWITACEGPEKTPFPYGYDRDPSACNIDNPWVIPSLEKIYSQHAVIHGPELIRLDQGLPSGAKPGCKSGFGVFDQTGNVDEWVLLETPRGKGGWAGLKGGAWGHVRNACRPVTTSHDARFTYYFVSFRCCRDAEGPAEGAPLWRPPPLPPREKTDAQIVRGFTPPVEKPPLWVPPKTKPWFSGAD